MLDCFCQSLDQHKLKISVFILAQFKKSTSGKLTISSIKKTHVFLHRCILQVQRFFRTIQD